MLHRVVTLLNEKDGSVLTHCNFILKMKTFENNIEMKKFKNKIENENENDNELEIGMLGNAAVEAIISLSYVE